MQASDVGASGGRWKDDLPPLQERMTTRTAGCEHPMCCETLATRQVQADVGDMAGMRVDQERLLGQRGETRHQRVSDKPCRVSTEKSLTWTRLLGTIRRKSKGPDRQLC